MLESTDDSAISHTAASDTAVPKSPIIPPIKPIDQTILVVDDEPPLLRLLEFLLARQGYTVLTATNGFEALQVLRENHPDLMVLDAMLPRLDGFEVAVIVRSEPAIAGTPIVMLTAKAQDADIERGMSVGVDTYITKPFAPEHLAEVIRSFLARVSTKSGLG